MATKFPTDVGEIPRIASDKGVNAKFFISQHSSYYSI